MKIQRVKLRHQLEYQRRLTLELVFIKGQHSAHCYLQLTLNIRGFNIRGFNIRELSSPPHPTKKKKNFILFIYFF